MRVGNRTKNVISVESGFNHQVSSAALAGRTNGLSEDRTSKAAVAGSGDIGRCQLSNTAPPTLHSDIRVGIDYLTFWVYGEWSGDVQAFFNKLDEGRKNAALEKNGIEFKSGGLRFMLLKNGSSRGSFSCRWCLCHRGLFFGLCNNRLSSTSRPLAKVEIKGESLTQFGVQGSLEIVDEVLKAFGICYGRSLLSRIDIKADHFGVPVNVYKADFDGDRVITRARQLNTFGSFQEVETISVGNRKTNRVVCRFYDKIAELAKKPDKNNLFLKYVTDGEVLDACTRVEFEVRREGLKELGIDSFEDCFGRLGDIVSYLTGKFLRIADSEVDRNHTDRAKTAVHWQATQTAFLEYANTFRQLPARVPEPIPFDATRHCNSMIGHLISWMIKDGVKPESPHDIMDFAKRRFLAGLVTQEVYDKYKKALLNFEHKNGVEAMQFFDNRAIEAKQALTGVEKISDADVASSTITKPSDLFEKEEKTWMSKSKRAA